MSHPILHLIHLPLSVKMCKLYGHYFNTSTAVILYYIIFTLKILFDSMKTAMIKKEKNLTIWDIFLKTETVTFCN